MRMDIDEMIELYGASIENPKYEFQKKQEALNRPMLEALERIKATGKLDEESKSALLAGVKAKQSLVQSMAETIIKNLAYIFPEIRELILEMAKDKSAHVRKAALDVLSPAFPRDFIVDRLRDALGDKRSSRVRQTAVRLIGQNKLHELFEDLDQALQSEKDEDARISYQWWLHMIEHGYVAEYWGEDKYKLNFAFPWGIGCLLASEKEIREKGIEHFRAEVEKSAPGPIK